MIELLLKFYKKKVISYHLVFRFMKVKYRLMKYSFLVFVISILPMIYGLTLGLAWKESRTLSKCEPPGKLIEKKNQINEGSVL